MNKFLDILTLATLLVIVVSVIAINITGGSEGKLGLDLHTLWIISFLGSIIYQIILYFRLNSFMEETNLNRVKQIEDWKEMKSEWKKMKLIPVLGTTWFYFKRYRKAA